MATDPYRIPVSDLEVPESAAVPEPILTKIRNGWIAALISAAITLCLVLYAVYSREIGKQGDFLDAWVVGDVIIVFALAFGIYKKSRIASTCMFIYFSGTKLFLYLEYQAAGNILLLLLFAYLYFQAMIGTYQYHRYSSNSWHVHAERTSN